MRCYGFRRGSCQVTGDGRWVVACNLQQLTNMMFESENRAKWIGHVFLFPRNVLLLEISFCFWSIMQMSVGNFSFNCLSTCKSRPSPDQIWLGAISPRTTKHMSLLFGETHTHTHTDDKARGWV